MNWAANCKTSNSRARAMSGEVFIFADWEQFDEPAFVGTLRSTTIKSKEHFSFAYADAWLTSELAQQLDPDLQLYPGDQHAKNAKNFRAFLDSCPDRWGRMLMKRREAVLAHRDNRRARVLNEFDYLLGVHDFYRMGALRFKRSMDGPFLDNDDQLAAPPFARLGELEQAVRRIEEQSDPDDPDYRQWLYLLIAPGSSLGGARPKASVIDENNALWIAKFPSRQDEYDVAAWEYVVHKLALRAGISMSQCRVETLKGPYRTFITQRFDRTPQSRLHFSSAMTQLGYYDGDDDASYLELAEFLVNDGSDTEADLAQLWRRIIFSIAVSNTDDHLRNHGFIYQKGGWKLSPAYDINPVTPAAGLHLFITDNDNRLDYALAMDVIDFFRLQRSEAMKIQDEVLAAAGHWRTEAAALKIGRAEQNQMADAFNV